MERARPASVPSNGSRQSGVPSHLITHVVSEQDTEGTITLAGFSERMEVGQCFFGCHGAGVGCVDRPGCMTESHWTQK